MARLRTLPRLHSDRARNLPSPVFPPRLRGLYDHRSKRNTNGLKACTTGMEGCQVVDPIPAPPPGLGPPRRGRYTFRLVQIDGLKDCPENGSSDWSSIFIARCAPGGGMRI